MNDIISDFNLKKTLVDYVFFYKSFLMGSLENITYTFGHQQSIAAISSTIKYII